MNKEVIFSIIYCLVTVGAFCAGKFIFPKIPASVKENLADLAEWAAKFVVWAREFLKMESGEKKMAAVVEQLKQIAEKAGIEVTEEQLKAIAQTAYEAMKAGEAEAQPGQLLEAAAITPGGNGCNQHRGGSSGNGQSAGRRIAEEPGWDSERL